MQILTKYRAEDGSEYETEAACLERDALMQRVAASMQPLQIPSKGMQEGVDRGKGWYQHNPETVVACRDAILVLCCAAKMNEHYPVFNSRGPAVHPLSIIGRILDDYGGPLNKAWCRFCRIDPLGREHQQCYFAYTAGPEPQHVCLNP